ncbi:hypothetical protein PUS82_15190 [Cytobacillus firmus]|uniref:hypothetical protein n=1 Tax=Cytobacillus firmus TaxID=1399 RepID=UPI00237A2BD2|nr:hypothetical protein [Cytobacillus firmus]MDD9312618.1 hypothetical protein [Cytobacillus firmus]
MKKVKKMSVREFLNGKDQETFQTKVTRHFKRYGTLYKIAGSTVVIFMTGGGFDYALAASSSIDTKANLIYYKLMDVGKWIIIFKGSIDTIKAVGNGDFDSAKKSFFSYLLIYILLLALPYGFEEIDKLFSNVKMA